MEGIDWIRVLYNYPQHFTTDLVMAIRESSKVVPYLDMPLQHISDRVLKMMNRRHSRAETVEIIDRLRSEIPGLVLRTTFIVGFPGETEAEFEELREFVKSTRFERLGVFPYSYESDTPSARLPGHLDQDVKLARRDQIMAEQQPIAFAFNQSLVGRELDVLIDRADPNQKGRWIGRTYADAPDIDGVVSLRGKGLRPGDMVKAEITESQGYDLAAKAIGTPVRGGQAARTGKGRSLNSSILPIIS